MTQKNHTRPFERFLDPPYSARKKKKNRLKGTLGYKQEYWLWIDLKIASKILYSLEKWCNWHELTAKKESLSNILSHYERKGFLVTSSLWRKSTYTYRKLHKCLDPNWITFSCNLRFWIIKLLVGIPKMFSYCRLLTFLTFYLYLMFLEHNFKRKLLWPM